MSYVIDENIRHFRKLLAGDLAPEQRATITFLLAREEAKLRLPEAPNK